MSDELRILLVEDDEDDAELIGAALRRDGIATRILRVDTKDAFFEALKSQEFDLILSDYTLPSFDGTTAMKTALQLRPDVPLLVVSGTIGEERAIETIKLGAADYILKDNFRRLGSAVRLALRQAEERSRNRAAEAKVREQAALLDKARDAIFVTDLEGRVVFWNSSAELLYAVPVNEAIGRKADQLFEPGEPDELSRAREFLHLRGEWAGELRQKTRDGRRLVVESRWTLVCGDDGVPRSLFVINSNVTARKELERQLLRSQRLESIGALAGGVAHDLNNVLSPILLGAQILRTIHTDQQSDSILRTIESSAMRGVEMIRQILTFARGSEVRKGSLQVGSVIEELTGFARETFPETISVQTRISPGLWPIYGDATQVYQVLMNLCVNARDAMPDGGKLVVAAENIQSTPGEAPTEPSPGFVEISVEDSGTGIPDDMLERIFEPFFTTKDSVQGTGLGLSTVLQIVENHGGRIKVESTEGKGSRFRVLFPAERFKCNRQESDPEPADPPRFILVIDDEISMQQIIRAMLESEGYQAVTANSGEQAIGIYRKDPGKFEAVVTDWFMPEMDGPSTIRELRKINPDLKFLGISGNIGCRPASEWPGPAPRILAKPFSPQLLVDTIRALEKQ